MGDSPRRPRPVVSDRFALQAWAKAEAYLIETMALQPGTTPSGMVHMAYYAMFHAARAVLLRSNGTAPKKHASVKGQFSHLAQSRDNTLRDAAHSLNKAEEKRIIADYRDSERVSADDAREALNRAVNFLDLCAKEFRFPREQNDNG